MKLAIQKNAGLNGIRQPLAAMVNYIEAKSILSKLRVKDTLFGLTYNMNLYRGCQHACIYCDTRSACYGINNISAISVKSNALELLARKLSSPRIAKGTIGTGSMNDPYMPIEKKLEHTRKALQIIANHRFPVHIITKSSLVARDRDLLQDISSTYAAVSFTITTADDALARQIEPHAPPTSERLKAMEALSQAGIYTGVTLMPLLPFINDTPENIASIMTRAKDAGASYIIPMFGVTLRTGSREYFYDALDRKFPGMRERYETCYGERYLCNSGDIKRLSDTFRQLNHQLGFDRRMKFYEPNDYIQQTLF